MKYKFDWDAGNLYKLNVINGARDINKEDVKSVFKDVFAFTKSDPHKSEKRWKIVGRDLRGRIITIIFTKRKRKIRYVTAWKSSIKKEDHKTYLKRI